MQFRLKQCGVRHPVYLVEEFGGISHLKLSERALEQAVANTQVGSSLVPRPPPRFYLTAMEKIGCEIKSGQRPGNKARYVGSVCITWGAYYLLFQSRTDY